MPNLRKPIFACKEINLIKQIFKNAGKDGLYGSFLSLFSGNILAQVITFVSIPFLANIYGPESYALLGIFIAICSTLTPSMTGKFEIAGVIAETDDVAMQLFAAALWTLVFLSTLIYLFYPFIEGITGLNSNNNEIGIILPIALLFSGSNIVWLSVLNRNRKYFDISLSLVLKALITSCFSFFLYANEGINGLILGFLLGLIASNAIIIIRCNNYLKKIQFFKFKQIFLQAKRYKSFPLLNASTSFFDGMFVWLPIYFITILFSAEELGIFYFLNRMIVAPLSLISNSLSPIILKDSAERIVNQKSIIKFFLKFIVMLTAAGSLIGIILFGVISAIINFGLDERWASAENFVIVLLPLAIIRFIISTLSPIFSSTQRNDLAGVWKIFSFIISFSAYSLLTPNSNFFYFIVLVCVVEISLYFMQFFMMLYACKNPR